MSEPSFYLPASFTDDVFPGLLGYEEMAAAAREERLVIQRCRSCDRFQHVPEDVCHECYSADLFFDEVEGAGTIFTWTRIWHPVHPALADRVPYLVVVVALDRAAPVRVIGNLLQEPDPSELIGSPVRASFEHHDDFTLIQWSLI